MKTQYIKITEDGDKYYHSDEEMSIRHREDGPAIEWTNGDKEWYINNKQHREDGPAIEWTNGNTYWYLNSVEYSEEEFNKKMKNSKKIVIKGKEFTVEELNSLRKWWWLNGICYSADDFYKKINNSKRIVINGKEFTDEELNNLIAKA